LASYLIQVRIMDPMKRDIRAITYSTRRNCNLTGPKPVPHITIVSNPTPFNPRQNENRLIADFNDVCSKYPAMEFQFNGFGSFPDNGVAIINITPPHRMRELRWDLICRIGKYCVLDSRLDGTQDYYIPHVTIANKLNQNQFEKVMNYLRRQQPPQKHYYLARATLLKESKILREYDFFLRRSLTRSQALSPVILAKTRARIRQQIAGKLKAKDVMRSSNPFRRFGMAIRKFLGFRD
jgi:2'-5' RNA ligase